MAKPNKSKAKTGNPVQATEPSTAVAVRPYQGAILAEDGLRIISLMAEADSDEAKAKTLNAKVNNYRGEAAGLLVQKVIELHQSDAEAINLDHAYSDKKGDKSSLFDSVQIGLGIKHVTEEGSLAYTDEFRKYFPPAKPTKAYKEGAKYKSQRSFQSNFVQSVKKACEAASGMLAHGVSVSFDEDAHVLRVHNAPKQIAGPSGVASLTGEQIEGAQERASLEAFRKLAARDHGKVSQAKGKSTNGESLKQRALESEDAFGELSNAFIGAVNAMEGNFTDTQRKHIESVWAVCGEALGV
ncbi:MAG: hypothetical protein MN733_03415 [Nitrososphaera sp.]|nr:hypothetical protein [Nitrososphaera sp.]